MHLSVVFVFYRTLDLEHLERAVYSLSKQTVLDQIAELVFVDNNTVFSEGEIRETVEMHLPPSLIQYHFCKHGDDRKRHSWSANYGIRAAREEHVWFTRADYIVTEDCLERMWTEAERIGDPCLVSGWCYQMGYDRNTVMVGTAPSYEEYNWREHVRNLLNNPHAFLFHETDKDAGVFVTSKTAMELGGWYDEAMVSFGYQQSTLQRHMRRAGVKMYAIPDYLFFHQHHDAVRDFQQAKAEYLQSRGG